MTTTPLPDLIAALESATEGSQGLSNSVARSVGWINRGNSRKGEWFAPEDVREGKPVLCQLHGTSVHRLPPNFTRSVDAARTLVPEGYWWKLSCDPTGHYQMDLEREVDDFDERYSADASTPALAICAAALRARMTEKGDG